MISILLTVAAVMELSGSGNGCVLMFFALNVDLLLACYLFYFPILASAKIDPDRERPYRVKGGKVRIFLVAAILFFLLCMTLFFTFINETPEGGQTLNVPLVVGVASAVAVGEIVAWHSVQKKRKAEALAAEKDNKKQEMFLLFFYVFSVSACFFAPRISFPAISIFKRYATMANTAILKVRSTAAARHYVQKSVPSIGKNWCSRIVTTAQAPAAINILINCTLLRLRCILPIRLRNTMIMMIAPAKLAIEVASVRPFAPKNILKQHIQHNIEASRKKCR